MEIKILTVLLVGACASSMTEAFSSPDRGGYQFIPGQVRAGSPSRNRYQFIPGRGSHNNRPLIGSDIYSLPPKDRPHSIRGRSLPPKDRPLIGADIASLPPKDRPHVIPGGDIYSLPPKDRPHSIRGRSLPPKHRPLIGADIASLPPKDRPHVIPGGDIASLPPKDRPHRIRGGDVASLPPKDRPLIGGDIASLPPKDRPKLVGPGGIRPSSLGQGGRHQRSAFSPLVSGHRSAPSHDFSSEESEESYPSFIGGATARPSNNRNSHY